MTSLWITRSEPGAQRLAQALANCGLELWVKPLIQIEKVADWDADANRHPPHLVIVTSQHAAAQYVTSELFEIGRDVSHIALGEATAELLRAASCPVVLPLRQSSEGVLALPEVANLPGQASVWIMAGQGGREVLQDKLAKCGVKTVKFESYRRVPAAVAAFAQAPDLIEIASSISLKLAVERLPQLDQTVFIVASARLESAAQALDIEHIVLAGGADVNMMKEAVVKAAEQQSQGKPNDG